MTALRWLLAFALLALAWNLKDPHLLPYRQFETAVVLAVAGLGMAMVVRRPRGVVVRTAWLTILGATLLVTLAGEFSFRYRRQAVLSGEMKAAPLLGRYFVVGYDDVDSLRPLVVNGLVGGIFVTRRNAAGKSAEELRQEILGLQGLRQSAGLPRLLVATDQEGGIVSRLSPPRAPCPGAEERLSESPPRPAEPNAALAPGGRTDRELKNGSRHGSANDTMSVNRPAGT